MPQPSTSSIRRAVRPLQRTDLLNLYPVAERPADISPTNDPRMYGLAQSATRRLTPLLPHSHGDFSRERARSDFCRWMRHVDAEVRDSSCFVIFRDIFSSVPQHRLREMGRILAGGWSDDVHLVSEILWRLELGQRTISAALWLHRLGT